MIIFIVDALSLWCLCISNNIQFDKKCLDLEIAHMGYNMKGQSHNIYM